jgi:hypothetical protein
MLTLARLKEVISYDEESGIFTWLNPSGHRVIAGTVAGKPKKSGYCFINIDNKRYAAHRLAWMYVNGNIPTLVIDHIDGNPSNNSIKNLREVTQQQNLYNMKLNIKNKSGYKGVHFHRGSNKWRAVVSVNNYPKHIGLFETPEEASVAYQSWCLENRGEHARIGI